MGEALTDQVAVEASQEQQAQARANLELVDPNVNVDSAEALAPEESERIITHQHADGAVRQAESVDAVRNVCPAMEGLSHRQVMLAMKMAARGRERQAKQVAEKATIDANPNKDNTIKRQQEAQLAPKKVVTELEIQRTLNIVQAEQLLRRREETIKLEETGSTTAQEDSTNPEPVKPANVIDIKSKRVSASKAPTPTAPKVKHLSPAQPAQKLVLIPKKTDVEQAPARTPIPVKKLQKKIHGIKTISINPITAELPAAAPAPNKPVEKAPTATSQPTINYFKTPEATPSVVSSEVNAAAEVEPPVLVLETQPDLQEGQEQSPTMVEERKLMIIESAVEITAVSTEVAEQATTLLVVMPEKVQTSLKEYIQNAEPEAVEAVEAQVVMIARVSDRLHELVMTEQGDSQEAAQIEEWLEEHYSELLDTLGMEYDKETIEAFIELVRSDKYEINPKTLIAKEPYDPMHERKGWSASPGKQTRTNLSDFLRAELARFAVHHGLLATPTALAA